MKIELSPGDWAGVLNAVIERGELDDDREASDDYMRIAGLIREQIAEAGRTLPELTPVTDTDDGESAACPHVWTAEEVRRMRDVDDQYQARGRGMHGDAWNGTPRTDYPEVGSFCGAELEVVERVWDYRPTSWHKGVLRIGDGQFGDGEFVELTCDNGHVWAMPEEVEYR
jgi:hypothetical protein